MELYKLPGKRKVLFIGIYYLYSLTLASGCSLNTLNIAISAAMVFPDPVGAPKRTLLSV